MLAHFVQVLVQCWPKGEAGSPAPRRYPVVALQLLQTLSILVQNTERETSLYYLFSNNYINDLIEVKQFDFDADEEARRPAGLTPAPCSQLTPVRRCSPGTSPS
jgi:hypothetical protein